MIVITISLLEFTMEYSIFGI